MLNFGESWSKKIKDRVRTGMEKYFSACNTLTNAIYGLLN